MVESAVVGLEQFDREEQYEKEVQDVVSETEQKTSELESSITQDQKQVNKIVNAANYSAEAIKNIGLSVDTATSADISKRLQDIKTQADIVQQKLKKDPSNTQQARDLVSQKGINWLKIRNSSRYAIEKQNTTKRDKVFNLLTTDPYFSLLPETVKITDKGRMLFLQALSLIIKNGETVLDGQKTSILKSFSPDTIKDYYKKEDMLQLIQAVYGYQFSSYNYNTQAKEHGYGIDGVVGPYTWESIYRDLVKIKEKNNQMSIPETVVPTTQDVQVSVDTKTETSTTEKASNLTPEQIKEKQTREKKIRTYITDPKLAQDIINRMDQGEQICNPYTGKNWDSGIVLENVYIADKKLTYSGKIIDVYYSPSMHVYQIHNKAKGPMTSYEKNYMQSKIKEGLLEGVDTKKDPSAKSDSDKQAKEAVSDIAEKINKMDDTSKKWNTVVVKPDGHIEGTYKTEQDVLAAEIKAQAKLKKESEKAEKAKQEAETRAKADAEKAEKAKQEAEAKTKADAEKAEKIKQEAENKAKADAEKAEKVKQEAENKAKADAEKAEKVKQEAETKAKADTEKAEKVKQEAENKAKADAEKAEKVKQEAETKAKADAEKAEKAEKSNDTLIAENVIDKELSIDQETTKLANQFIKETSESITKENLLSKQKQLRSQLVDICHISARDAETLSSMVELKNEDEKEEQVVFDVKIKDGKIIGILTQNDLGINRFRDLRMIGIKNSNIDVTSIQHSVGMKYPKIEFFYNFGQKKYFNIHSVEAIIEKNSLYYVSDPDNKENQILISKSVYIDRWGSLRNNQQGSR